MIEQDLGSLMMVDYMKRTHGLSPDDVRYYFADGKGGVRQVFFFAAASTIASALDIFEQVWSGGKAITDKLADPLLLAAATPGFGKAGDPGGLGYDSLAKSWTASSVFASHDSKIVFRSAGLLGYPETFRYKEVLGFKGLLKGFLPAVFSTVAAGIGGFLMFIPVTRRFIAKKFLP
ncbi:unnamed protein product, partial [Ectocarpus fasciculatus]